MQLLRSQILALALCCCSFGFVSNPDGYCSMVGQDSIEQSKLAKFRHLLQRGRDMHRQGQYETAHASFASAYDLAQTLPVFEAKQASFYTLAFWAKSLAVQGKLERAIEKYEEAFEFIGDRKIYSVLVGDYWKFLMEISRQYETARRPDLLVKRLKEGVDHFTQLCDAEPEAVDRKYYLASLQHTLGIELVDSDHTKEAVTLLRKAAEGYMHIQPNHHSSLPENASESRGFAADCFVRIAQCEEASRNTAGAISALEQSNKLLASLEKPITEVALRRLGRNHKALGFLYSQKDSAKAAQHYQKAQSILKSSGLKHESGLAAFHAARIKYEEAHFQEAIQLAELAAADLSPSESMHSAFSLYLSFVSQLSLGRTREAIESLPRITKAFESLPSPVGNGMAAFVWEHAAKAYRVEDATPETVLSAFEKASGYLTGELSDSVLANYLLSQRGAIESRIVGRRLDGLELQRTAIARLDSQNADLFVRARAKSSFGGTLVGPNASSAEIHEAVDVLAESERLLLKTDTELSNDELSIVFEHLAEAHYRLGQFQEAATAAEKAAQRDRLFWARNGWILSDSEIEAAFSRALDADLVHSIAFADGKAGDQECANIALQTMHLAQDLARFSSVMKQAPTGSEFRQLQQELRSHRDHLSNLIQFSKNSSEYLSEFQDSDALPLFRSSQVETAIAKVLELEERLSKSILVAPGDRLFSQIAPPRIIDSLRDDEALLLYSRYRPIHAETLRPSSHESYGLFVFVGSKGLLIATEIDGSARDIDELISRYLQELTRSNAPSTLHEVALHSMGIELYEKLLAPAISTIERGEWKTSIRHFYVCAESQIGLLPLEALPIPHDAQGIQYALERYGISYIETPRDLVQFHSQMDGSREGSPVAFIDNSIANSREEKSRMNLLKAAMAQHDQESIFTDILQLKGILYDAESPRIIQVLAHAKYDTELLDHVEITHDYRQALSHLRSTILAGDSEVELTALDVLGLNLLHTDLVVLAGCETGLGDVNTHWGVVGLKSAFRRAGALAVIASRWKIPDSNTMELLTRFYRTEAIATADYYAALRESQLQLLAELRDEARHGHPYWWAGISYHGLIGRK